MISSSGPTLLVSSKTNFRSSLRRNSLKILDSINHKNQKCNPYQSSDSMWEQGLAMIKRSASVLSSYSPLKKLTNMSHYDLRKHFQKIEFIVCWAIVLVLATTYLDNAPFEASATLLYYFTLYLKASGMSRALAYCSDFTNASEKFDGDLPLWLILHHSGCLVVHFSKAFFLLGDAGSCRFNVLVFALSSQSSHNTWTKKHSLFLYWGNVLVGVLTAIVAHREHLGMGSDLQGVAMTFLSGLVLTSVGILFLVAGSIYQRHFFLTLK